MSRVANLRTNLHVKMRAALHLNGRNSIASLIKKSFDSAINLKRIKINANKVDVDTTRQKLWAKAQSIKKRGKELLVV
jgi:hypothetical protein